MSNEEIVHTSGTSTLYRVSNPKPVGKLSAAMIKSLRAAAERSDGAITETERRTWGALYARGLVDVLRGLGTGYVYQGPFRPSRTTTLYNVVTGVYINDAGRELITSNVLTLS